MVPVPLRFRRGEPSVVSPARAHGRCCALLGFDQRFGGSPAVWGLVRLFGHDILMTSRGQTWESKTTVDT